MSQTVVVKIGTSSLTKSSQLSESSDERMQTATGELAISTIATLVERLTHLRQQGNRVILVSSGAIGVGCVRLGLDERPRTTAAKQAIAAIGQGRLMRIYDDFFSTLNQPIAQILLARRDFMNRHAYVNASNTFGELLQMGAIPIVNENDTTAIEELNFGDNDTLSALVASLVEADWLFLLTDVDRLYSADPREHPDASPIPLVNYRQLDELQIDAGKSGSAWGTGGMQTKLAAARIATSAGVRMAILHGRQPENIERVLAGEAIGTQFEPHPRTENARKRWIAYGLIPLGTLTLDNGAVAAICERGKSLLAAGITQVEGEFSASDAAILCDLGGKEVARGLVNYSSEEIRQILGQRSQQIPAILGYASADTVIHRDNLVVTAPVAKEA